MCILTNNMYASKMQQCTTRHDLYNDFQLEIIGLKIMVDIYSVNKNDNSFNINCKV